MGIDETLFVYAIASHFKCVVCNDVCEDVVTTSCQHLFCRSCLAQAFLRSNSCPTCRTQQISVFPLPLVLQNIYYSLELRCSNSNRGCHEIMTLERWLNSHRVNCPKALATCPYPGCDCTEGKR